MLRNYFKIALNSLRKNPLYTSVTLFGISFTLMVLIFSVAVLDNELGSNRPMGKVDDMYFINGLNGVGYERIKDWKIDSTYLEGKLQLDSVETETINRASVTSETNSGLSLSFYKKYIKSLQSKAETTAYFPGAFIQTWKEGKKVESTAIYADEDYWKIFDFRFKEGKPFTAQAVENGLREVVITEKMARKYFGKKDHYLNETFDWGSNGKFKVVGVVETPNASMDVVRGDIFIPLTLANKGYLEFDWSYFGGLQAVVLLGENQTKKTLQTEITKVEKNIPPKDLDDFHIKLKTNADNYALTFMGRSSDDNLGQKFLTYVGWGILFFLLVPLFNLIQLNNSRVMERAGEIGVRKAFGAQTWDIFNQFLFENFIITLIGGILGIFLSMGLLGIFNYYEWLGKTHLSVDWKVALYSFFIIVIFSFLSGVIPALRISKFNIVNALKHSNL